MALAVHAKSWFEIMPKTLPRLIVGGGPVAPATMTRAGWAATAAASIVILALAVLWGGAS